MRSPRDCYSHRRCPITSPVLANNRGQSDAVGQVVLKLKTPWHDGSTHLVMSPLESMRQSGGAVAQLPRRSSLKVEISVPNEQQLYGVNSRQ
jgi:hypothetical protein